MCCNNCKNYEPKLPAITHREIALSYYSVAPDDCCGANLCDEVGKLYGLSDLSVKCGQLKGDRLACGSRQCLRVIFCWVNEHRGYEKCTKN